jgi:hypothetical protein
LGADFRKRRRKYRTDYTTLHARSGEEIMKKKTPEITRLIHDNLWVVISFAFGQPAIAKFVDAQFKGEWKYLNKTVYERAEIRADRALLEMATQLRVLDDAEQLSSYFAQTKRPPMGVVIQADDSKTELHFRDLTNKLIHSEKFEWQLSDPDNPKVICYSNDLARWKSAEIDLTALMALIGLLMH